MKLQEQLHLSYCTNIHPGESWEETLENLKKYAPPLREQLSPRQAFGLGLRLSNEASQTLLEGNHLAEFKTWLEEQGLYVFTLNGFPYGGFHRQSVKDEVHRPDWTMVQRKDYTLNLVRILAELLPEGMDGGISTSPLTYKYWWNPEDYPVVFEKATENLIEVLIELRKIKANQGKLIHIDIEPEPDGLLENTQEVLDYYAQYLVPMGIEKLGISPPYEKEAEAQIKTHLQLCYDVCHFAVGFEEHAASLKAFQAQGIRIGKFQISAALKALFQKDASANEKLLEQLKVFNESTYLHQVVEKSQDAQIRQYPDLPQAIERVNIQEGQEWRIHFHVPIFLKTYGDLASTQNDILEVFALQKQWHYSNHLEVETYTWEVLPTDMQLDLLASIERELRWVKTHY